MIQKIFYAFVLIILVGSRLSAADQPNILFIFTDDQAPWALGVDEYEHAITPNMDRIAKEGVRFTNAFTVTPVCSPSRAELLTSRFGTELNITEWIHPKTEPTLGLDPSTPTWSKLFADAGYQTGLIGKWHLGTEDKYHPSVFGYNYFMGFREGGNRPKDAMLEVNGKVQKVPGLLPDVLTDDAIRFVKRNQDKPFLLSLHFRAPHAPWLPVADEDWSPFEKMELTFPNPNYPKLDLKKLDRKTREYLASVASVDRNVGRLLQTLDDLNIAENTIVIYSSDHGYNMGHNGIWHKGNGHWILTDPPPARENIPRGQRPNMYDNSLKVPLLVRWPGKAKPGTIITESVRNIDWFPTLCAMAGISIPENVLLRGKNFVPLMEGKTDDWENSFYAQYSTHHQTNTHMRIYRTPEWKLILDFLNPGRNELYNLKEDPNENHNLYSEKDKDAKIASVVEKLTSKIREEMEKIDDPVKNMPVLN